MLIGGKREFLAKGLLWSGASSVIARLPAEATLLVLNYHRIGDADGDPFDPAVFSATAEEFDRQITYLKRRVTLITLEEALALIEGRDTGSGCRALITFDDGYLDNYEVAFPILRSHDVQGVFFLATSMAGSCDVPWWDHMAHVVKSARRRRFALRYPSPLEVDLDRTGLRQSLRLILNQYKRPEANDSARFIRELTEACQGDPPPSTQRRFLDWTEAREMIAAGMVMGSHTNTHPILSQVPAERQREELAGSKRILEERLGARVETLAYPVGQANSFSDETQRIARETGYRAAFSFYGGINRPGEASLFNIQRVGVGDQSWGRFQVQVSMCRWRGQYWP